MQLKCRHCLFIAKSFDLDRKKAMGEVLTQFANHTQDKKAHSHLANDIIKDTMKVTQLSTAIIMIAKHSTLLDLPDGEEDYLQEDFTKLIEDLQEALGVEVDGVRPEVKDNEEDKSIGQENKLII